MFRPIAAIIRFSTTSMLVVFYRIGMFMSGWWDLIIPDVCYKLWLWVHWTRGGGLSAMCAILGCTAQVCLPAAVLRVSADIFVHFRCLLLAVCYIYEEFTKNNHLNDERTVSPNKIFEALLTPEHPWSPNPPAQHPKSGHTIEPPPGTDLTTHTQCKPSVTLPHTINTERTRRTCINTTR